MIELRDGKLDMIVPQDSGAAYEAVCSQLGYDTMGIPTSEDDVLKFEEYRQSGDLGSVIVASVLWRDSLSPLLFPTQFVRNASKQQ